MKFNKILRMFKVKPKETKRLTQKSYKYSKAIKENYTPVSIYT